MHCEPGSVLGGHYGNRTTVRYRCCHLLRGRNRLILFIRARWRPARCDFPWFNISHPIESISKRLTKTKKDLDWLFEPYDPNEKCGIDALAENIDETIDNAKKLKAGIDDSLKKLSNHDNNLPRPELPNPIECIQNVKLPNPEKVLPDIKLPKLPNPLKRD